jgi:sugar-specific transcriptional regulator TrmB
VQKDAPTFIGCDLLSQEAVKNALKNFGLTEKEAEVYIFLAKRGALKSGQISKQLKKNKGQVYRILSNLKKKGVVEATLEFPTRFVAVPLEKTINAFIKSRREEISLVERTKQDLLRDWEKISKIEAELTSEKFSVIEGNKKIFQKILEMVEKTQSKLSATSTVTDLVRAEQFGVFDTVYAHPKRYTIDFRFLTELSKQNLEAIKLLKPKLKAGLNVKARNPELGLASFPRMVIKDNEELLFFISPEEKLPAKTLEVCIHTNCGSLVQAFASVFTDLWQHSIDLQNKIFEIETGKPTPKTIVITDAEMAEDKYNRILRTAEKEILLMTSAKDLALLNKRLLPPRELAKRNITAKIMAPITNENFQSAETLSKYCEVKHVPTNYWRTLIVDGKQLLQFRSPPTDLKKSESTMRFENAFYSEDSGYLKMMKTALNDIWKRAQAPSTIRLKSGLGPLGPAVIPFPEKAFRRRGSAVTIVDFKPPGTITEKDVLNKIIWARKFPAKDPSSGVSRLYASGGRAVIHPPGFFNLPDMIISATHAEKQSTFGGGDYLMIFLSQKTPKGEAFVPVSVAYENPKNEVAFKAMLAGTPAAQNVQLVKGDELQVRIHGNTLFAGWTVPIQLFPSQYVLPPACLLIEGYGEVKTRGRTAIHKSGFKTETEGNFFNAYVTFFHPASKYSGPGTDGVFTRDFIMTKYPPGSWR